MQRVPRLRWGMVTAAGALWALALGPAALAQQPGQPGQPGPPPGQPSPGGPGGMLQGIMGALSGLMAGGGGGGPQVAATDRFVYVLRGDQLFSFDASSLKQTGQTMLPMPPMPQM